MKLKMIGSYNEIPNGKTNLKSIKDTLSSGKYENQDKIIEYLKQGIVVAIAPGGDMKDVINPQNPGIGIETWLTDGTFIWCSYLPYYVEKYNLILDDEVIEHMKISNFKINITEKDIDFDNIEEV